MKNRTPEQLSQNEGELRFLKHVATIHRKLQLWEQHKQLKPYFSQACDRLSDRIAYLLNQVYFITEENREELSMNRSSEEAVSVSGTRKKFPHIATDGESLNNTEASNRVTNNNASFKNASSRRSPHRAYYAPPKKGSGWRPLKTNSSAWRGKQDSTSPHSINVETMQHTQ